MYTWLVPHLYKINGMWNKWMNEWMNIVIELCIKVGWRNNPMLLMCIPVLCMKQAGSFLNSSDVEEALSCVQLFKITHGFSVLRPIHVKWKFKQQCTGTEWSLRERPVLYIFSDAVSCWITSIYCHWYVNETPVWSIILTGNQCATATLSSTNWHGLA